MKRERYENWRKNTERGFRGLGNDEKFHFQARLVGRMGNKICLAFIMPKYG